MLRVTVMLGLALCLAIGVARADEAATEALIERLAGIDQLAGRFSQVQYASKGDEVVGTASGSFRLLSAESRCRCLSDGLRYRPSKSGGSGLPLGAVQGRGLG